MIEEIKKLRTAIKAADPSLTDVVIKDLHDMATKLLKQAKRSEKVNNQYGIFFDKVISSGTPPEAVARELNLL